MISALIAKFITRDPASSVRPPTAKRFLFGISAHAALSIILAACSSQPQTVVVHQPTVPPIQAGLRTCQPEPPLPSVNGSDVAYAQYLAGAVIAGRDCRNVLGKLVAVLDAFAASIKDQPN